MISYARVTNVTEFPTYKEERIKKYQTTKDIIKDLIYCFKHYHKQARAASDNFKTGNVKESALRIYSFICDHFVYDAEPDKNQTTRSFSRMIHDRTPIDCKHNALIVACIGWNLGYNVIFRFVSYYPGETYGHVYVILEDPKTKERVIVDPLQKFNFEKGYLKRINYKAVQPK